MLKTPKGNRRVVICGCSAAGLFTARLLAEAGLSVSLYERSPQLDPAPRTLIATSRLEEILGEDCETAIVNRIHNFDLYANGKSGSVALDPPDVVVERIALIRRLYESAVTAGADVVFDRRLTSWEVEDKGLRLRFSSSAGGNEEVATTVVVGADGQSSTVARLAGWDPQPNVPLAQAVVKLPDGHKQENSIVWFRPQDTPYFYWLIPNGPNEGALGLIGSGDRNPRTLLDRFLKEKRFEPLSYQAARIPRYSRWKPISRRLPTADVYLVGDAAGHVKVSTVGGLVTGFRGATAVAKAIVDGSNVATRAFRLEMDLHLLVRKVLHGFKEEDYVRLLDLAAGDSGRSLGKISRDEALSVLLRVARSQPRLVLTSLRAIAARRGFPHVS